MTFLVLAVHERLLAEDVLDRTAQGLAAVDHEEDRLLAIEPAVDEVGQQRARERGVLGRALPQPERDLDPLGGDPERDDLRAVGDLQAVEHHHGQAHVIEPAAHHLAQRGARALDEQLRHRRLGRGRRRGLDVAADGSPIWANFPVETPASMRSITARVSGSRSAKNSYVASGSSCSSSAVRMRGRRTCTRRSPSVSDPFSCPWRFAARSRL
jgi:hypothetical protein